MRRLGDLRCREYGHLYVGCPSSEIRISVKKEESNGYNRTIAGDERKR